MEQIDQAAASMLAGVDRFFAEVRQTIAEGLPVGAKTEKIKCLREKALSEIEGLLGNFDRAAQDKEKDLTERMARLGQLRDQVAVIRYAVLPMFAYQPRTE